MLTDPSKDCSLSPRKCWTVSSLTFSHFSWLSSVDVIFPVTKRRQHRSEMLCREVTFPLKGIYLFKVVYFTERLQKEITMARLSLRYVKQQGYPLLTLFLYKQSHLIWYKKFSKPSCWTQKDFTRFSGFFFCWFFKSSCMYEVSPVHKVCSLMFLPCSSSDCQKDEVEHVVTQPAIPTGLFPLEFYF